MEGSNSDSDSKENSVVESGIQKGGFVEIPEPAELPEIVRERIGIKKTQFRGFYLTQKTLVVDSNTSSLDYDPRKQACSLEAENEENINEEPSVDFEFEEEPENEQTEEVKKEVPTIIEEFINVTEEVEEDEDATENSDIPVNVEDKAKIEKDHENPGIDADFIASVSQVRHSHENDLSQNFLDVVNTSDEDISELVSEVQELAPEIQPKSKLRISLKNIDSSDEEENIKSEKSEKRKAQKKVKIKLQSSSSGDESGNETEISDIIVSDMDYYKIRHQTDVQEKEEYCLSWSPTKFVTRMKSFDEDHIISMPNIKTCDISDIKDDGNDTSDEDFSCFETDFMTLDEFLVAYKTNFEFDKKEEKIRVFKKQSTIQHESTELESEKDVCNTESIREDLYSDTSSIDEDEIEDLEQDTDSEEVATSIAENPPQQMHSPGCIHFMEHADIGGIVAFLSPSKTKKWNKNFEAERFEFESDSDGVDEIMTEEIIEEEKTNVLEMLDINDNTDEENLSDLNDEEVFFEKDINLNIANLQKEKEEERNRSINHMNIVEKEKSSEDEILENFVMSPVSENVPLFPNPSLDHLDGGKSTVKSSQSIKMKNRKKRNRNLRNSRKIEIEEI